MFKPPENIKELSDTALGYGAGALTFATAFYFMMPVAPDVPRPFSNGYMYYQIGASTLCGIFAQRTCRTLNHRPQIKPVLKGLVLGTAIAYGAMRFSHALETQDMPPPSTAITDTHSGQNFKMDR